MGCRVCPCAEGRLLALTRQDVQLAETLPAAHRKRLRARIEAGLTGEATLVPLFHLRIYQDGN